MPTAKKLPSGSWRCQVYSHTDPNGKRVYKSFTCADPSSKGKRICEAEATAWAKEKENRNKNSVNMTFSEAAAEYIASRENVLSPSTIRGYRTIEKSWLGDIGRQKVNSVTQSEIQKLINNFSANHSPKSVKNLHGFISAILNDYRPDMALKTKLPKPQRYDYYIPSEEEVKTLIEAARGTTLELPIYLAAFGPMRRGEICALRTENIDGATVHVCENMVRQVVDGKHKWIIKDPKSYAGDRYITYPDFVAEKFKGFDGLVCPTQPDRISKRFNTLLLKIGLPHFRFHDLRHYSASILHAIGVPDQYIMERGGWGSDAILKQVYRHSVAEKTKEENEKINNYFSAMQHEISHE